MVLSQEFRERILCAGAGLSSASVLTLFMFPAAWVLERILHRLRSTTDRFSHVTLTLMTIGLYINATEQILYRCEYIARDPPAPRISTVLAGIFELGLVPLLILWAVVAFRGRRR
jgi:hypothetical protein